MNRIAKVTILLTVVWAVAGCATPIGVRPSDRAAVGRQLSASAVSANMPSVPSSRVMLRLGFVEQWREEPEAMLAKLHTRTLDEWKLNEETTSHRLFALAEFSYLHATRLTSACKKPSSATVGKGEPHAREPGCDGARAYYVAASMYAYAFLFPDDARVPPNPLDPRLRTAGDIYNLAVTAAVRQREGRFESRPISYSFHLGHAALEIDPEGLEYAGRRLGDIVPAAQLHVRGLRNRYRHAGIGAPFVASAIAQEGVEIPLTSARVADQLRIPITIFVRYDDLADGFRSGEFRGRVEIYNENHTTEIEVAGQQVPLEYETSAALAYSLENSRLWDFEIAGFRSGDALPVADGLVMMSPYQSGKIPVVFVHGTASSPARWAEMLNDYMSDPILRTRYQFWYFIYTTGNPVLYSASLLRESLQNTLVEIDPESVDPALQRIVVVGHSQGGLLTKLQAISGGTSFWDVFSDERFEEIEVKPHTRELLRKSFFFEPQPFVERVVFISTPHHGSFLAGNFLGRIASSLFSAPTELIGVSLDLAGSGISVARRAGKKSFSLFGLFRDDTDADFRQRLAELPSSVDNMDPNNRFTVTLQSIAVPPEIRANSIIPVRGTAPPEGQNDGVVEYESAHIEEAESEYIVYRSGHSTQGHPETIQELRRILLEHIEVR